MPGKDPLADIPHERKEARPDFTKPPPTKPLPKSIQQTLDNDEKLWEVLTQADNKTDSTDSSVRYAAYASRLRTILVSAQRYVAYTSDIGESFRPIAHPNAIRAAYGVSWLYLGGDVCYEGYKAYNRNLAVRDPQKALEKLKNGGAAGLPTEIQAQPGHVAPIDDYRTVMAQRAIFQSIASMGLPAFTIHSVVRYSGRAFKGVKNVAIRTWAPIGLGLAVVPFLPYLFDKPVEHAVEWSFHKGFEAFGGTDSMKSKMPGYAQNSKKEKEKEL